MAKKHKLLKDPMHWLGWLISGAGITGAVVLIAHLMGIHAVHTPISRVIVFFIGIFTTVVVIDVFKHKTELQ